MFKYNFIYIIKRIITFNNYYILFIKNYAFLFVIEELCVINYFDLEYAPYIHSIYFQNLLLLYYYSQFLLNYK